MTRQHGDAGGPRTVIGGQDGMVSPAQDGTSDRRIGSLLVDIGRLTPADVEVVLEEQTRSGGRFGDIARKLGLVERAGLEESLARRLTIRTCAPTTARCRRG
jgi:hypothetical protein